jgi:cytoskeleton protein RodZ
MVNLRLRKPAQEEDGPPVARLREVVSPQARLGADLRSARMRRGLSLADVAHDLRIRQVHLVALEDGRFDGLPGRTYVVGFLRSYGRYLGLDAEELVTRFREESGHLSAPAELNFPEPLNPASLPTGRLALAALAVGVVVFGGWYIVQDRANPPLDLVQPVPEELAQAVGTTAAAEPTAATEPDVAATARAEPQPEPVAEPEPEPVVADVEAEEPLIPELEVPESTAAATETSAAYVPTAYGQTNAGGRVVLRAVAESWIQVNGPGGELVVTRILRPGDLYAVPDRSGLTLVTGNAGGLEVLVDGAPVPSLGAVGEVRRGIDLDPERLKAGAAIP